MITNTQQFRWLVWAGWWGLMWEKSCSAQRELPALCNTSAHTHAVFHIHSTIQNHNILPEKEKPLSVTQLWFTFAAILAIVLWLCYCQCVESALAFKRLTELSWFARDGTGRECQNSKCQSFTPLQTHSKGVRMRKVLLLADDVIHANMSERADAVRKRVKWK